MMPGEGIGEFGDARRAARGAWLFDRIVAMGSLCLRKVGGDRAGEIAAHRFLDSPQVSAGEIIATLSGRTGERCHGQRIIVAQDTTEINFSGRARARRGLGPAGDGETPGFFLHAAVAVDAADEAVVGLLDAAVWTRWAGRVSARRKRALAEKESQRWLSTSQIVAERAAAASQVIVVGDRESDIFGVFARRPPGVELLVRAAQDRALAGGGRLFAGAAAWPVLGQDAVKIGPRGPGDKGRLAQVSLRAGTVRIARPRNGADRADPPSLDLTLVEVREDQPPAGLDAVHWRLLTTLPAKDLTAAREIAQFYRLRWRIEQTFRACKTDGLGLPDLQTHEADRLFKMAARCAPFNWSMPATAASGRAATSPKRRFCRPRQPSGPLWKARRNARRTRTRPARCPGWPGSSPGSAVGIAITNRRGRRRCAPAGISSPR